MNIESTEYALDELEERHGELLKSQAAFIYSPHRRKTLAGGFASGKTRAGVVTGLILSSIFKGNEGIIGRYRGTDLEDSVKPLFFDEVTPPSWIRSYNKQTNTVVLKNNSKVYFRHIHDASKRATKTRRLGANLGWFLLDQMEEMEKSHYDAMLSRLRNPKAGKRFALGTLNPNGHDWIYDMFYPGEEDLSPGEMFRLVEHGDNLGVIVNSNENRKSNGGFVDDDYFDQMVQTYSPEWYNRYVLSSFADFSGKIYKMYGLNSVHNIKPFKIPDHWDIIVGIDVGGDSPWGIVAEAIDEVGNTVAFWEHSKPNMTSHEVAAIIKANIPWNQSRVQYVIDWENKLAMLELAEFGIHAHPAIKDVHAGLLRTQGYFHVNKGIPLPYWYYETQPKEYISKFDKKGAPRTFVFDTLTTYRKDHDEYVWDENKINAPKKTKDRRFDTVDADRYIKMKAPLPTKSPIHDKYAALRKSSPVSAKEWDELDKRIAARMNKDENLVREANMDEVEAYGVSNSRYDWND